MSQFLHTKVIMNVHIIIILNFFCAASMLCFRSDIALSQPSNDESVIFGKIISNYLHKYFSNTQFFVSIIFPPSKKETRFLDHFFSNLFNDPITQMFARNVLNKLDNSHHENSPVFNLILVDDSKSLKWVSSTLVNPLYPPYIRISDWNLKKKPK